MEFLVELGSNRQIELPEQVVRLLALQPGDRLLIQFDEAAPERVRLRRIRRSYAGIFAGLFGSPEEALEYIHNERASWGDDE